MNDRCRRISDRRPMNDLFTAENSSFVHRYRNVIFFLYKIISTTQVDFLCNGKDTVLVDLILVEFLVVVHMKVLPVCDINI